MAIINLITNFSSEHWVIRPENLEQMTSVLQSKYDTGSIANIVNNIGDPNILTESEQPSLMGNTLFFPIMVFFYLELHLLSLFVGLLVLIHLNHS